MLQVIQEVMDPQTKILFIKMSDRSILMEIPGELQRFSKNDFIECDRELNLSQFTRKEVIEAFERVESLLLRRTTGTYHIDMEPIY